MSTETIRQGRSLYVFGAQDASEALRAAKEAGLLGYVRVNHEQLMVSESGEVMFAAEGRTGYRFSNVEGAPDRLIGSSEEGTR